jgi:autotransporter-associated beta strand protein
MNWMLMNTPLPLPLASRPLLPLSLLTLMVALPLSAAIRTWDGSSSGNWSVGANWAGNVAPVNGDDLVFPAGAANLICTNDAAVTRLRSITFIGAGGGYNLRGIALTLTNGIAADQTAGANTVSLNLTLGANQTFSISQAGASLVVNGSVALSGYNLTVSSAGISGLNGSITGTGNLTKTGTGSLALSGSPMNTFSGTTRVNAGTLFLTKSAGGAIQNGTLIIGDGSGGAEADVVDAALTQQISAGVAVVVNSSGLLLIRGNYELDDLEIYGGVVETTTAAGRLRTASLVNRAHSTRAGELRGLVELASTLSLSTIGQLHSPDLEVPAQVIGASGLTLSGPGIVRLSASNSYSGLTVVSGGNLQVADDYALGAPASGTVVSNGAVLGVLAGVANLYDPLTLNGVGDNGLGALQNAASFVCHSNVVLQSDTAINATTGTTLEIRNVVSGVGGLTKLGAGALRLAGSTGNTYNGNTVVDVGTLELHKSAAAAIRYGTLTIGDGTGGANADVVRYTGTGVSQIHTAVPITVSSSGLLDLNGKSDDVNGSLTLNDGRVQTGAGTLTLLGPATISVSGDPTVVGNLNVGSGTCVFQGSGDLYLYAATSGSANLVKNGSLNLHLRGANSFTGNLTANDSGYVYALADLALGTTNGGTFINDAAFLALADVAITNESLTLDTTSSPAIWVGGAETNVWSGHITLSQDAICSILTNTVLNIVGPVTGAGSLTKRGPGLLQLSGAQDNTFAGMVVDEGRVELNKSSFYWAVGGGSLVIGDGAGGSVVDVVRHLGTSTSQIRDTVPVIVNTSGLLDLNGKTDTLGPLTLAGGTILSGAGLLQARGDILVKGTNQTARIQGNLEFGNAIRRITVEEGTPAYALEIQARISDTGNGFIITNATPNNQFVRLSGSNSYTGPLNIGNARVLAEHNFALGQTNGTTTVSSNGTLWLYVVNVTNQSLTLTGNGELVGQGTCSWNGSIVLDGGPRIWNADVQRLTLNGPITGTGNLTLHASSPGTIRLTGSPANTFAGDTTMLRGTLELAKNAFDGAIPGNLQLGDATGFATALYLANNQIVNPAAVTLHDGSVLDVNGFLEGISTLNLYGSRVETGAGYLALYGAGRVNVMPTTATAATINGNLRFNVDTTFDLQPATTASRLNVNAQVYDFNPFRLIKTGPGSMALTASNNYRGLTLVQEGYLTVTQPRALGTTDAGTVVSNRASLLLWGNFGVTNEALTLNGVGAANSYAALEASVVGTTNVWAGPVTLNADSTMASWPATTHLRLLGSIGGPGGLIVGPGAGGLWLEGSDANTFAGTTRVNAGTLWLNKVPSDGALPGDLVIGDGSGSAGGDVVRLLRANQIHNDADVVINASGLLDFNGHYDRFDALSGSGPMQFGSGGYAIAGHAGATSTYDGRASGDGYIWKVGTGTLTLNGDNPYTGQTHVEVGTLLVEGDQAASPVRVDSTGALGGRGRVGIITCSGTVRPGTSPGVLHCSNFIATASAVFQAELNGANRGIGYDQLEVSGTNNLGGMTLALSVAFPPGEPVFVGQQFVIVDNDGTDPIVGTFAGLPGGSLLSAGGYQFQLSYAGGTGNDVVLTLTQTPAAVLDVSVLGGNRNQALDPNECDHLRVILQNRGGTPMTGIRARLWTTNEYLFLTQTDSLYPDLAPSNSGQNTTLFQLSCLPGAPCGDPAQLWLTVDTASHGSFLLPVPLWVGGPAGAPVRYDSTGLYGIPDPGSVMVPVTVAGFVGPVMKAMVSCHITHNDVGDLTLELIAPNGTVVPLATQLGGAGNNYGTSCLPESGRTTFDDDAPQAIGFGTPPFAGAYRPQSALAPLVGLTGAGQANGTWSLRVTDAFGGSSGTVRCWSLFLYPAGCTEGGGICDTCPGVFRGAITLSDPTHIGRPAFPWIASACGVVVTCPPIANPVAHHYDLWAFTNAGPETCVTVALDSTGEMVQAVAYLDEFNPANQCQNFLGTAATFAPTARQFAFNVPAGRRFLVKVNELTANAGCTNYTLIVSGLPCPPVTLAIAPAAPGNTVLSWPTWAAGYEPERTIQFTPTAWFPFGAEPQVMDGRFTVTNPSALPPTRFIRLKKP